MLQFIKNLLGLGPKADFAELVRKGAVIVDVRTANEYKSGHIKGSVNIPLNNLEGHVRKLKEKGKPVITCCASGMRSASAKALLASGGIEEVYNGGGWQSLRSKI